jgi:hypothetical protein
MKVKEFNIALMFLLRSQHTPTHIPIGFKTLKVFHNILYMVLPRDFWQLATPSKPHPHWKRTHWSSWIQ